MDPNDWTLTGNAGTDPATNFLGTTDNQPLVVKTNGTEALRIDTGGNVGIGTTNVGTRLEIASDAVSTDILRLRNTNAANPRSFRIGPGVGRVDIFGIYDDNAAEVRLAIDYSGNVGIGTTTPGSKLDVVQANSAAIRALSGDSNSNTSLSIGRTADEGRIGVAANSGQFAADASVGDIILRTETATSRLLFGNGTGSSAMAIQNGNVGIGTTDPSTKLEVGGQIYINITDAPPGTTTNLLSFLAGANGLQFHWGHFYLSPSSIDNRLYFGASNSPTANPPSPIMTWDVGTGNVGIGTADAGARLEVNGNCSVSGDVLLTGNDCAEEFDIAEAVDIEPGTVMVLDQDGALHQSHHAYDKRVAGVVSGAGDYRPGLILDRRRAQDNRLPIALVGKVYCKVDARYAPIEVGDLLTTSFTPGHAMKADDPLKAFGSVIGKALRPLEAGQGMIPILIALQ